MGVAKFPTATAFGFLILAVSPALAHALPLLRFHVNKIEGVSLSLVTAILLPTMLASCGKKTQAAKEKTAQKSEDDFLDKDAKPEKRKYPLAAKPFFIAVTNRKYADAYALLSSHAKARMSFNQFSPAEEQATFQQVESNPYINVTAEQFGAMDSMFAIGAMPDWIPANIRRASLRGQIHTELSPQEVQKVAQQQGISAEQLQKEDDFDPYLNLKVVLVEEGGQLKIGYFEFLPPSMLD